MALSGVSDYGFSAGHILRINWRASQNIAGNYTNVVCDVQLYRNYYWSSDAPKYGSVTINGQTKNFTCTVGGSGWMTADTFQTNVGHNSNGTQTLSITASLGVNVTLSGVYFGTQNVSGSWGLNTIPRQANITHFSATGKDFRSVSFKFTTDATVSEVYLHINGGGRVGTGVGNVTSGSWKTGSLNPNTNYTFQLEVVRKDSGLASWSSKYNYSTKSGCTALQIVDNPTVVGNAINLKLTNSDLSGTRLYMYITSPNSSGTSVENTNVVISDIFQKNGEYTWTLTSEQLSVVYSKIKYSNTATMKILAQVFVPGETDYYNIITSNTVTYNIDTSQNLPTLSTIVLNSDSITQKVLGSTTHGVRNVTTWTFSAIKGNMSAKNNADLSTLVLNYGNASKKFLLNATATTFQFTIPVVTSSGDYVISAYITDSRGNQSKPISKTYDILSYNKPVIVPKVTRALSSGGVVDLSYSASYSRLIVSGTDKNSIKTFHYGYSELGTAPKADTKLPNDTFSNSANGVDKTISFTKTSAHTLNQNKNYIFLFTIEDALNTYTVPVDLVDGNPLMRILETGQLGINCKPDTSNIDEKLRVGGAAYVDTDLTLGNSLRVGNSITASKSLTVGTTLTAGESVTGQNVYATKELYEAGKTLASKYAPLAGFTAFQGEFKFETKTLTYNGMTFSLSIYKYGKFCITLAATSVAIDAATAWGGTFATDTIDTGFTYPYPYAQVPCIFTTYVPLKMNGWSMVVDVGTEKIAPKVQILRGTSNRVEGGLHILSIGMLS